MASTTTPVALRQRTGETQSTPGSTASPDAGTGKKSRMEHTDVLHGLLVAALEASRQWSGMLGLFPGLAAQLIERGIYPVALPELVNEEVLVDLCTCLTARAFVNDRPVPFLEYIAIYSDVIKPDMEKKIILGIPVGERPVEFDSIAPQERRRLVEWKLSAVRLERTHIMWHEHHISLFFQHRASQPTLAMLRKLTGLPVVARATFHRRITQGMRYDSQRVLVELLRRGVPLEHILCFSFDNFQLMYSSLVNLVRQAMLFTDIAVKRVICDDDTKLVVTNNRWPLLAKVGDPRTDAAASALVLRLMSAGKRHHPVMGADDDVEEEEGALNGLGGWPSELQRWVKQGEDLAAFLIRICDGKGPDERRSSGAKNAFGLAGVQGNETSDEMVATTCVALDALLKNDTTAKDEGCRIVVLGVDTGPFFNAVRFLRFAASLVDDVTYGYPEVAEAKAWFNASAPAATSSSASTAVEPTQVEPTLEDESLEDILATRTYEECNTHDANLPQHDVIFSVSGTLDATEREDASAAATSTLPATNPEDTTQPPRRVHNTRFKGDKRVTTNFDAEEGELVHVSVSNRPAAPRRPTGAAASTTSSSDPTSSAGAAPPPTAKIFFPGQAGGFVAQADALTTVLPTEWHFEHPLFVQGVYQLSASGGNLALRKGAGTHKRSPFVVVRVQQEPHELQSFESMHVKAISSPDVRRLLQHMGAEDSELDRLTDDRVHEALLTFREGAIKGAVVAMSNLKSTYMDNAWKIALETRNFVLMPEIWHLVKTGLEFFFMSADKSCWGVLWDLVRRAHADTVGEYKPERLSLEKGFGAMNAFAGEIADAWTRCRDSFLDSYGKRVRRGVVMAQKQIDLPASRRKRGKEESAQEELALGQDDIIDIQFAFLFRFLDHHVPVFTTLLNKVQWAEPDVIEAALIDLERCCRDINATSSCKSLLWYLLTIEHLRQHGKAAQATKLMQHVAETTSLYIESLHASYARQLPASIVKPSILASVIGSSAAQLESASVVHAYMQGGELAAAKPVEVTTSLYHNNINSAKHAKGVEEMGKALHAMFAHLDKDTHADFCGPKSVFLATLDADVWKEKTLLTRIVCNVAVSGHRDVQYEGVVAKLRATFEEFVVPAQLSTAAAKQRGKDGFVQAVDANGNVKATEAVKRDSRMERSVFGIVRSYCKLGELPYQEEGCGWCLPMV